MFVPSQNQDIGGMTEQILGVNMSEMVQSLEEVDYQIEKWSLVCIAVLCLKNIYCLLYVL